LFDQLLDIRVRHLGDILADKGTGITAFGFDGTLFDVANNVDPFEPMGDA